MDRTPLYVTAAGHLAWAADGREVGHEPLPSARQEALASAFTRSLGDGLLALVNEPTLPPSFSLGLSLARAFLTAYCRDPSQLPGLRNEAALLDGAPPIFGSEYLNAATLRHAWAAMSESITTRLSHAPDPATLIATLAPAWRTVGRITLHLAENARDQERPFAFLATYSESADTRGQVQYRPLAHALRETAQTPEAARLLPLLAPLREAIQHSALLAEMVESRHIFQPLAWTAAEAWAFLHEVPAMEAAGLIIKIPDWWEKKNTTHRIAVTATIEPEQKKASSLGMDSLLRFDVAISMGGDQLSEAEIERLLQSEAPLISLRGRWVEVDATHLRAALQTLQRAAAAYTQGIPYHIGLRLASGFGAAALPALTLGEAEPWVDFRAGPDLLARLHPLREPHESLTPPAHIPGLRATLRPYQALGVAWLERVATCGLGACLADDMGLGKTIQVIALILLRRAAAREPRPSLLVVPASLLGNWDRELRLFAPDIPRLIAHRSLQDDATMALLGRGQHPLLRQNAVLITTYTTLSKLPAFFEQSWDLVVLDEAQAIKNASTAQAQACRKLNATYRIALTGTPIENSLDDLWGLFAFLNPGLLGSPTAFAQMTRQMEKARDYAPLRRLVQPCILRRMKSDPSIAPDLPAKIEVTAFCHLSKRQASLYQRAVRDMAKNLAQSEDDHQRCGAILGSLLRLKQICNHPSLFSGDGTYLPEESGKFQRLAELCAPIAAHQERVLVFTQFREMTHALADYLTLLFRAPGLVLHGDTPIPRRAELVARFQDPVNAPPFFVISLKAGGTGLTLTAASHVIHFDRWWNPAVEDQATDRAYRIGQTRRVMVHKMVCTGTLEARIDHLISQKKALAQDLLHPDAPTNGELFAMSDEELLRMVSFDASTSDVNET
jgi:hypothetical protein